MEEGRRMIAEHRAKSVERVRSQISDRQNENVFNQSDIIPEGQQAQFMKGMTQKLPNHRSPYI